MSRPPAPWTSFSARSCRLSLIVGGLGLVVTPASPVATAATTFQVTASVLKGCLITTPPAFDADGPTAPAPDADAARFAVTCTAGTVYSVGSRLYRDASYSTRWDSPGSNASYTGTGNPQPIDVYGRLPVARSSAAPLASDGATITVTLSY